MNEHEKLNYVEFGSNNLEATKAFFTTVFHWSFTDYGPDYIAFNNQGLEGGFFYSTQPARQENGSALLVFYSNKLELTQTKIEQNQGIICKAVFDFPGGRRFHFIEPGGNEFAVWSDH
ncbi:VOC family protein [Amphritea balenae]|mgnify:CR=1 FL=1|uniref:VOC family protein n=1 Tax=Amphritea balenae TaxID=452629 RepID=A0A3P1SI94_9GAMM|nr:VOC family protein [Amphritea balenae]RRC96744.1 VOC family protein [Amphritea balenae]